MLRTRKSFASQGASSDGSRGNSRNSSMSGNTSVDIGWVGPITLRRRAKPELEYERHRDISLRLSVQEVKNLTRKGRYFCEVRLDRTLYARTTSKSGESDVFWGEKFDLNNLPEISIITINLFKQASIKEKRQRLKGQNQFIAFVTIPLTDLNSSFDLQQWFSMQPAMMIPGAQNMDGSYSFRSEDGRSSAASVSSSPGGGLFRKRSTPIGFYRNLSTSSSNSVFFSSNGTTDESNTSTQLVNGKKKISWTSGLSTEYEPIVDGNGGPKIISSKRRADTACTSPKFHSTHPSFAQFEHILPQLRLCVQYEAIDVLPLDSYTELCEFVRDNALLLIKSLEPRLSAKQKEELASCFVNIHEKHADFSIRYFLSELLKIDLQQNNDETMIFRSNSTGSKAVECYIKLVGSDYLQELLRSFIDQMLCSSDDFELDPSRITISEPNSNINLQLERNREALIDNVSIIWKRICSSHTFMPNELRQVFYSMSTVLEETHGFGASGRLISSCLFLRFICPAIHGPILFGLASAVPESCRISRNLTLVAKVMQNLANLTLFEDKEPHMKSLNEFISQEIPLMQSFLRTISQPINHDRSQVSIPDYHNYIDLGYEFAKLTNLLNMHFDNIEIPNEISVLRGILKFIHEHTTDDVLSSWTPGIVASRKFTSHSSSGQLQLRSLQQPVGTIVENSSGFNKEGREINSNDPVNTTNKTSYGIYESDCIPNKGIVNGLSVATRCGELVAVNPNEAILSGENDSKNMDDLLAQYHEQLRQLNACIDKVDTVPEINGSHKAEKGITVRNQTHCTRINDQVIDFYNVSSSCTQVKDIGVEVSSLGITDGATKSNDGFTGSDYEGEESRDRKYAMDASECNSEPLRIELNSHEVQISDNRHTLGLPESPSLDQLAERLEELKFLLHNQREEFEHVVATKTEAIQRQEKSIEQLATEINQLRQTPRQTKVIFSAANDTNTNRLNSDTISPSSSFTSECYSIGQSDTTHASNDVYNIDIPAANCPKSDNMDMHRVNEQFGARSQSFRVNRFASNSMVEQITKCCSPPNLFDLTRVSEGTGIPLGDLIVSKQADPMKRRFSETKLIHN